MPDLRIHRRTEGLRALSLPGPLLPGWVTLSSVKLHSRVTLWGSDGESFTAQVVQCEVTQQPFLECALRQGKALPASARAGHRAGLGGIMAPLTEGFGTAGSGVDLEGIIRRW